MNIKFLDEMERGKSEKGRGGRKNDVVRTVKEVMSQNIRKS